MEYMTKEDISDIIVMHSNSYNCLSMLMNICCQERRIEKVEDFAELLGENYSTCDNLYNDRWKNWKS